MKYRHLFVVPYGVKGRWHAEAAQPPRWGRAFASVVANVRSLAMRSASSAKVFKGLVADPKEKVNAGIRLVDDTGRKWKTISTVQNA